ncbi:unnamed protein product [Mytilus coruscus]|uniref:Uncharacterized protein n=1 Tax=Mytilus coruscus TaxID=42192 RepID=A0A6J8CI33_MYTCO|nr:unnamed protein product [Mytilus coruscus]
MFQEEDYIGNILADAEPLIMSTNTEKKFKDATNCYVCGTMFSKTSGKVRDHSHIGVRVPIKELVGLRPKMYSLIYDIKNGDELLEEEKRTAKGIAKCAIEKQIRHIHYKQCLVDNKMTMNDMDLIQKQNRAQLDGWLICSFVHWYSGIHNLASCQVDNEKAQEAISKTEYWMQAVFVLIITGVGLSIQFYQRLRHLYAEMQNPTPVINGPPAPLPPIINGPPASLPPAINGPPAPLPPAINGPPAPLRRSNRLRNKPDYYHDHM